MDVVVTTPKTEIENARKEGEDIEKNGGHWFRSFKFKPNVKQGDKIYFVENGEVTGYGIIFGLEQIDIPENCDVTGREWGDHGDWVVRYKDWHWLKPRPKMKGFQGLRYVERLPDELKKSLCG